MGFECALSATRGDRAYQEDSAVFWPGPATFAHDMKLPKPQCHAVLAILADGMGGHAGGAIASETACRTFLAAMAGMIDLTPFRSERTESTCPLESDAGFNGDSPEQEAARPRPPPAPADDDDLTAALIAANELIGEKSAADPSLTGMGTTLVGASFTNEALEWISVGDSPLYLWRGGEIALLNEDHSLAPALDQLARDGHISREAALTDPRRHMLRSALTGEPLDLLDRSRRPLKLAPEDIIILASDGIQSLGTSELPRLIAAGLDGGAAGIASGLVEAVDHLRVPHQDNTTVMVVRKSA